MKRWTVKLFAFSLSLVIGAAIASFGLSIWRSVPPTQDINNNLSDPESTDSQAARVFEPEFFNITIPEASTNELNAADLRSCKIDKTKKWLALFKRNDRYTLERPQVAYGQWGQDAWGGFFPLEFKEKEKSILVFNGTDSLTTGDVKTIFLAWNAWPFYLDESQQSDLYMPEFANEVKNDDLNGYRQTVMFEDTLYRFRIASATNSYGSRSNVFLIESNGLTQFILEHDTDQRTFGDILWMGDLDNDSRLDLLFSYPPINGDGMTTILYVSSFASKGELFRPYATYFPRGSRQCK